MNNLNNDPSLLKPFQSLACRHTAVQGASSLCRHHGVSWEMCYQLKVYKAGLHKLNMCRSDLDKHEGIQALHAHPPCPPFSLSSKAIYIHIASCECFAFAYHALPSVPASLILKELHRRTPTQWGTLDGSPLPTPAQGWRPTVPMVPYQLNTVQYFIHFPCDW